MLKSKNSELLKSREQIQWSAKYDRTEGNEDIRRLVVCCSPKAFNHVTILSVCKTMKIKY